MEQRQTPGTLRFAGALGIAFCACQTYDCEPVTPLAIAQTTQTKTVVARQAKPNLMLLVDTSGSMDYAANEGDPRCPAKCGYSGQAACPSNCPTRLSEMKAAMGNFLGSFQATPFARVGMLLYPHRVGTDDCAAPTKADIIAGNGWGVPIPSGEDDAVLKQVAAQVNTTIQAVVAIGGTPTSASLAVGFGAELGNTCNLATKVCAKQFYQASSAADLTAALVEIGKIVGVGDPCTYVLDALPSDERLLSVLIDDVVTPKAPDTWRYEAGKVIFQGSLCKRVSSATPSSPVEGL